MKTRLHDDHVRLRLTRSEVDAASRGETIATVVHLRPRTLTVRLVPAPENDDVHARFDRDAIEVRVPLTRLSDWANSDTVSIDAARPRGEVGVLIEKDFRCLHGEERDDQSDCFPNPLEANQG